MGTISRFDCPSSPLRPKSLLRKTEHVLWVCLGIGAATHLSLTQLARSQDEQKAPKPLTTQFVKRQPRLSKPLELKKRPQPKRRPIERTMVSVKARKQEHQSATGLETAQALGGLARPSVDIGRVAAFGWTAVEPTSLAQHIEGTKEVEQRIDMSLELLDIEALDTGRYPAMVVQDPADRRRITGFCRLAVIYSPQFHRAGDSPSRTNFEWQVEIGFRRLVRFMNEATEIDAEVLGRLGLNDKELFKAPWTLFSPNRTFHLSDSHLRSLGRYLLGGGFVFADGQDKRYLPPGWKDGFRSLRLALVESLKHCGVPSSIEKLPDTHPVYHCYFDFSGPPGGCDIIHKSGYDGVNVVGYVEGIQLGERLLALVTGKEYGYGWAIMGTLVWKSWDPTHSFRFGVNTIILSLTQEGSITRQLMDTIQ